MVGSRRRHACSSRAAIVCGLPWLRWGNAYLLAAEEEACLFLLIMLLWKHEPHSKVCRGNDQVSALIYETDDSAFPLPPAS
jgi:hypothetical protein